MGRVAKWLKKFHGELGARLRNHYDTEDLVQSAMTIAIRDVVKLRDEAAFFAWVSTIIGYIYTKVPKPS